METCKIVIALQEAAKKAEGARKRQRKEKSTDKGTDKVKDKKSTDAKPKSSKVCSVSPGPRSAVFLCVQGLQCFSLSKICSVSLCLRSALFLSLHSLQQVVLPNKRLTSLTW